MLDIKTNTALNDLKSFLSKLFQFESADLDFGIYKILHYKKAEVENFINQLLTEKVREQLNIIATVENEKLSAQVKELEQSSNISKYLEAVKKEDTGRIEIYEEDFKSDIEKYKTLSDRTLGRLGRNPLTTKATDAQKKTFTDEVIWIKSNLGADYLDRILKRIEHQKNEVVIAVENVSVIN